MSKHLNSNEQVVLVDEQNQKLGLADKYEVHTADTPLHRAFSLFLFNPKGELLLQQRAAVKKTWPNIWSNSVCGHPADGESFEAAAIRRADYEIGIQLTKTDVKIMLPKYRYRYEHLGVVENEFCPVLVGFGNFTPKPNPNEVQNTRWVKWIDFLAEISKPNEYSKWCVEEANLLERNSEFKRLFNEQTA